MLIDTEGRVLGVAPISECDGHAYEEFLEGNRIGMHATIMSRRECIARVGGFDQALRACEDYDLYLRMTRLYCIGSSANCLADYRQHGGNTSLDLPLMLRSALHVLRRQAPYGVGDPNWRRSLQTRNSRLEIILYRKVRRSRSSTLCPTARNRHVAERWT